MVNGTTPLNSTALSAPLLQSAGALNGAPAPAGFAADGKVPDFSALLNLAGDGGSLVPTTPAAVPTPAIPALVPSNPANGAAAPAMSGKPTGKTLPLADRALPEAAQTQPSAETRDAPEQALADAAMIVEAVTTPFPLTPPVLAVSHIAAPPLPPSSATPKQNNTTSRARRTEVILAAKPTGVPVRATAAQPVQTPPRPAALEAVSRATRAATLLSPGVAATTLGATEIVPSDQAQARQPLTGPAAMPTAESTVATPRTAVVATGVPTASASDSPPVLPQLAAQPAPAAPQAGATPAGIETARNATSDMPTAPFVSQPPAEVPTANITAAAQPARPQPAVTLMPSLQAVTVATASGIASEPPVAPEAIASAPARPTSASPRSLRDDEVAGKAPKSANTMPAMLTEVSSLTTPLPLAIAPAIVPEMRPASSAPGSPTPLAASAPPAHDFAVLVDRIAEARESGSGNVVRTTIRHADFGPVAMQFRADEGLTSVTFFNSDPAFAPAVQAAAATAMASQAGDQERPEQQSRHEQQLSGQNPPQQQSAAGQTGTGSQHSPQQPAHHRAEPEARAAARNIDTGRQQQQSDRDQTAGKPDRRAGIYA